MSNLHKRVSMSAAGLRPPSSRRQRRTSRAMRLGFGTSAADHRRRRIELFERELRRAGRRDGRRHDRRQRSDAADTGFKADRAVAILGSGRCAFRPVTVANDPITAVESFDRRLGGAKAGKQACERDRVSGDKRNHALP